MTGAVKKMSGWCFILADFEVISVNILTFIVYGQQNSCFDRFCGAWAINLANSISSNYQVLNLSDFSPLNLHHLSDICPMFHRTTNGQQSDNERTRKRVGTELPTIITIVNDIQDYTFLETLAGF